MFNPTWNYTGTVTPTHVIYDVVCIMAGLSLCSGDTDDMIDLLSPSDNPQRERTPFCLDNTSCFHFKDSDQHSIASNSFGSTVHNLYMVLVLELQIKQALWRCIMSPLLLVIRVYIQYVKQVADTVQGTTVCI